MRLRIGLVVLAVPQLATGVWALLATQAWFDQFPGIGPRFVAATPPFNAHLATDVGAGFFATAVALLLAAGLARRDGAPIALGAYLAFGVPHVLYHLVHPAQGLSSAGNLLNVTLLSGGLALAAVLLWDATSGLREVPDAGGRPGA